MPLVQISEVARLLTDKSKVAMLHLLMDGEFHTVTELAKVAGIKSHTASYHIHKLLELEIVQVEKQGRFHYYQLINQEIASFFERIGEVVPPQPVRYLSQKIESQKLYQARTCYDHLAGKLGVLLADYLLTEAMLSIKEDIVEVTELGEVFFEERGLDLADLKLKKRKFCGKCVDWSERRYHISGSLGKAMLDLFLEKQWLEKKSGSRRINLTTKGMKELPTVWGISSSKLQEIYE